MTNSKREYNETIRANLPYGITYDSTRYQYVTFNGKRFVTYLEAKWYIDYLTKFGGGPEDDIRNDLFGVSEEGVWFEANDSTTLFTDVAGTTPVTTPGDAVALQLDKSGRGNHRTQATTAARPLYALHPVGGVRNLLEYTEDGSNWTTQNLSQATLDGEITLTENAESSVVHRATIAGDSVSDEANIIRFEVKPNGRTKLRVWVFTGSINVDIDVENQTLLDKQASMGVPSFSTTPDGFTVVTFTGPSNRIFNTLNFLLLDDAGNASYTGDGTSGFIIRKPQLELGSTATNYQRVGSFLDVSETGKARRGRLWYNGTSHFMETGTITPGTDKVQVFAGVRKLRNNAQEAVLELNNFDVGGLSVQTLTTFAPWRFGSRGDAAASIADATSNTFPSPVSSIITGLGDISGDSAILRVDGVQEAISTADQGAGNYATSQLRFGARAGTSLFFNGYEDTSIIRFGSNLDATTISKVESYVASKTPASELLIPAGPELVTNGDGSSVTGWTGARGSETVTATGGRIRSTSDDGTTFGVVQALTGLTIGNTYLIKMDAFNNSTSGTVFIRFQDRMDLGGADSLSNGIAGNNPVFDGAFITAADTTMYVGVICTSFTAGENVEIDNISVRQFIPK